MGNNFEEYKRRKEEMMEISDTPDDVYIPPKPYRLSKDFEEEEENGS
jgi:hypothetical protein